MPLPFNKTLDVKLLKLVKDNPMIYNEKHPKYMDYDAREVVWQKIGDELNRPGQICKSRWINMRDMMRKKLKDRINHKNLRRHLYKYEEELSFMLPFFRDIGTPSGEDYTEYLEEEAEIELPNAEFVSEYVEDSKERVMIGNKTMKSNFESLSQDLNQADPLDVFLITIGSTLRKFTPYYLNQAKSKIFQVVQDYELQQIVDKDEGVSDSNR
ncbi:uncharacterized protein LOC106136530 [Amyelois transitella]|uniref:uncharacterized protein LOC106136530 n=1 Tax=Amyelois transitella TaxID=680683 RepID=UPI00067BB8D2|nr:uncharacterized protein LOC106136530 [Amyelois transitella]